MPGLDFYHSNPWAAEVERQTAALVDHQTLRLGYDTGKERRGDGLAARACASKCAVMRMVTSPLMTNMASFLFDLCEIQY